MAELNKVSPARSPRGGADSDDPGTPKKKKGWFHVEEPDYGAGFKYDPDFNGPTRHHSCTDVICIGLFIAFLCGWAFVAYYAYTQGDINKVWLIIAHLLCNTDLNVSQVAFDSGFEDLSHFSKAFRQVMGSSPSGYRNAELSA